MQKQEQHHEKVLIQSFHLSGHTFRFCWIVRDLEVFFGLVKFVFGSEQPNQLFQNQVGSIGINNCIASQKYLLLSGMGFFLKETLTVETNVL